MKLIIREQFNQKISTDFNYAFNLDKSGLYTISISARCQSGEQIGIRGGEDLRVEINGRTLREVPPEARPQYKDIPSAWSGTQLKNLKKTVVFLFYLNKGNHIIKFIPYKGAFLEEVKVWELNSQTLSFEIEEQAEDGDCRPWITFVLVDLPLETITADTTVKWRLGDSDDVKLIIDNKIKKNNLSILHRNWLWSANILKKLLQKERQEKTLREDLLEGIHYIEFWADRMPVLHKVILELKESEVPEEREFQDPTKIAEGFNQEYIIKDFAFSNKESMSEEEIQEFLEKYHQVKDKPHISQIEFSGRKASYWIKKASEEYSINPKVILTKLQAEQGLIKDEKSINPSQHQLDGALGVGMLDDGTAIRKFQGFVTQITEGTRYFREFYSEAESKSFTHPNIDGQRLKLVNAATYSLYRYTPHIKSGQLFYEVYETFFGTDDLGGVIETGNKTDAGKINLKFLISIILFILLVGVIYFFTKNKLLYSWQYDIPFNQNIQLMSKIDIISQKDLTVEDGAYCGTPFYKTYQGEVKLLLLKDNRVIDSIDLTNPDLLLEDLKDPDLTYYLPWDIDGDGKKQEFVVREYVGCNGHLLSFIRINEDLNKLEKIPVIRQDSEKNFVIYVDIGGDSFKANDGILEVRYYDNTQGKFFKDWYKYDRVSEAFVWSSGFSL